jgi:hypothetical protein
MIRELDLSQIFLSKVNRRLQNKLILVEVLIHASSQLS